MEGKFLDSPSDREIEEVGTGNPHFFSNKFEELYPYYISMGMSYEEYWEGDPRLVICYRKAYEIKKQQEDEKLWLQGMYIYDALIRVSPILHAFANKDSKPIEYLDQPYSVLQDKEKRKQYEEEKAKRKAEEIKQRFLQFVEINNQKFKGKENKNE